MSDFVDRMVALARAVTHLDQATTFLLRPRAPVRLLKRPSLRLRVCVALSGSTGAAAAEACAEEQLGLTGLAEPARAASSLMRSMCTRSASHMACVCARKPAAYVLTRIKSSSCASDEVDRLPKDEPDSDEGEELKRDEVGEAERGACAKGCTKGLPVMGTTDMAIGEMLGCGVSVLGLVLRGKEVARRDALYMGEERRREDACKLSGTAVWR